MPIDLHALGKLIRSLNPYTTEMEHPPVPHPAGGPIAAGLEATEAAACREFYLEIDDHIANYSSTDWNFRGNPQTVKRAIRITYRYQLKDIHSRPTGFYATEHVLIGYAGGNGGT
jgi:hypothetical protein